MDQSQLFSKRAYVFDGSDKNTDSELELVKKIFFSLESPIKIENIKLKESTHSYDIYKAVSESKAYTLKLSFADDCKAIHRENDILNSIECSVAPTAITSGQIKIGENIQYSIMSHEQSDKVIELGRGFLVENFKSFCQSYKILRENDPPQNSISEVIGDLFDLSNLENNFLETSIEAIESYTDKQKIKSLFSDIKTEIASSFDSGVLDRHDFCHGNLCIDNILCRNNTFKMINFDYAHRGNVMFDLSRLILSIGCSGNQKTQLIREFCSETGVEFNESEYNSCEKINLLLVLHNLAINYLYEVYMFDSAREINICNIINEFAQNYKNFHKLRLFEKHRDFISRTVIEPIVGKL